MHFWGNLPDGQMAAVIEWLYDCQRARREEDLNDSRIAISDAHTRNNVHQMKQPKVKQGTA